MSGRVPAAFQPTFSPGDRVEIVTSTGYGHVTGRIIEQLEEWWALDQSVPHVAGHLVHRPIKWVAVAHVVTVTKTEEQ